MKQRCMDWWVRGNVTGVALKVLLGIALSAGIGEGARSQIVPDGTLGTIVSPLTICPFVLCQNITDGTQSGNALFHSFTQFSPQDGTAAVFINPNPAIANIIGRVTGTSISDIQGAIVGRGDPFNLFLLNPNGIVFGRNARLSLNGSFFATTASSIKFDNNTEFGINTPAPLLTVNVPIGLQFGSNPGSIQVQGTGAFVPSLFVNPGNTIALVGSGVEMQGGTATANEGRVEIGSVAPNTLVNLTSSSTGFALDYSNFSNSDYRDIRLFQDAGGYANAGEIRVRGRKISLESGAALTVNPTFNLPGGNIEVYGSESVEISGTSNITTINTGLYAQNQGDRTDAGDITVTTPYLNIREGGVILNSTRGTGQAGDITINATRVELRDSLPSALAIWPTGLLSRSTGMMANAGSGGNITVDTEYLLVTKNTGITASTNGPGAAGNLEVVGAERVDLDRGKIEVTATGSGNAGNINIDSRFVRLDNESQLSAENQQGSTGGSISFENLQFLNLNNNSEISASSVDGQGGTVEGKANWIGLNNDSRILSRASGSGNSGDIDLTAGWVTLENGSQIAANHTGIGQAGNVKIITGWLYLNGGSQATVSHQGRGNAGNLIAAAFDIDLYNGSQLSSAHTGEGNAGGVGLFADRINVVNDSQVTVNHQGSGAAGNLISIADSINLENYSQLSSSTQAAQGGNITLRDWQNLSLDNHSQITAATVDGQGGTITLNGSGDLAVSNNSSILANATGSGSAGGIALTAGSLILKNDSTVATNNTGGGNAGSLEVSASLIQLRDRAQLNSATQNGTGGNITLRDWQNLSLDNDSQITAATVDGQGGTITLAGSGDLAVSNNSSVLANATGSGSAGNLAIATSGKLSITNDSQAAVRNTGSGDAGNLSARSREIFLSQRGRIAASTAAGNGGNIDLRTDGSIILRFNSEISAEAGGTGNGGNITLNTGGIILGVLGENSDIVANAFAGNGGNIIANTLAAFTFRQFDQQRTPESDFIASSVVGIDGTVTINANETPQPVPLPDDFLNSELAEGCDPLAEDGARFTIVGQQGLAPAPAFQSLSSSGIWEDLRSESAPLVEAQTWRRNERGNLELVTRLPQTPQVSCAIY